MPETKHSSLSKPLILLAFGHAVTDLSQGALPIILPFLKSAFGLTYAQVGIIVLAQNITSSVIQPIFGYITDRLSLPWLVPAGVLLSGIGMAITGLMNSYYMLLCVVVITGFGIAAFHPQASKGAHFVSSGANQGRNMAVFSVGGNFGNACGSLFMTGLMTLPGLLTNTVYFGIPAAIAAALLWFNLSQVSPHTKVKEVAAATARAAAPIPYGFITLLLCLIFVRSSIHAGLTTYIPLYYVDYLGGSAVYASYLVSIFLMAGVAGTYCGGTLSDKFGRKTMIIASLGATLPLIALIQYTTGFLTVILMAGIGFCLIASFVPTLLTAQEVMTGYEAMAAGLTIGFSIGLGGIGATALGYVADHFGMPSVFTVLSVLPLAAVAMAFKMPGKLFSNE